VTTSAGQGGTITPPSGWERRPHNSPDQRHSEHGYNFTGFSGDLTGTATPQNLTMNGPHSAAAAARQRPRKPPATTRSPDWHSTATTPVTPSRPRPEETAIDASAAGGQALGLLLNYNVALIKDGITRIANSMQD